ncbi:MAG: site-2 protease family protein [Bryobacterales bacterium]|jgi:Zn-dependent protease|nr:site-2 protease family protein [Bryobacterales bacterium]
MTGNWENAILQVLIFWMLTTPHEFAHAWTAVKLGDDTPRNEGRLTLNPLAHVDWLGTVILPAVTVLLSGGFLGWGRPVNTNPYRLRGEMKGLALVALAGPASNVVMAAGLALVAGLLASSSPDLAQLCVMATRLSLYLAIFNMLPVPPLDGSKLLLAARAPAMIYEELARFGFVLLILAMSLTNLGYWMASASWTGTEFLLGLFVR